MLETPVLETIWWHRLVDLILNSQLGIGRMCQVQMEECRVMMVMTVTRNKAKTCGYSWQEAALMSKFAIKLLCPLETVHYVSIGQGKIKLLYNSVIRYKLMYLLCCVPVRSCTSIHMTMFVLSYSMIM